MSQKSDGIGKAMLLTGCGWLVDDFHGDEPVPETSIAGAFFERSLLLKDSEV